MPLGIPLYDKNNNMIESETKFAASSKDLMMLAKVKRNDRNRHSFSKSRGKNAQ